jgi:hypothetical protein
MSDSKTKLVKVTATVELMLRVPTATDPNEVMENIDYSFEPQGAGRVLETEITHWEIAAQHE